MSASQETERSAPVVKKSCWNNYELIQTALSSDEKCLQFLQNRGLILECPHCPECRTEMKLRLRGNNSVNYRCRKYGQNPHSIDINILKGTFFENAKLGLRNAVSIIYFFSINKTNYTFLRKECSDANKPLSKNTVAEYVSFCREICFVWLFNKFDKEQLLGGKGVIVEVDLARMGKQRCNKGNITEETWVLWIIETHNKIEEGRYRMEICPDNERDPTSLISLVLLCVKPGTIIATDLWNEYFRLAGRRFTFFTVNHDVPSITPITAADLDVVDTWRYIKKSLKSALRKENHGDHLTDYLYRREVKLIGEDEFEHFLETIRIVFSIMAEK